jgi:hypothetical protein
VFEGILCVELGWRVWGDLRCEGFTKRQRCLVIEQSSGTRCLVMGA